MIKLILFHETIVITVNTLDLYRGKNHQNNINAQEQQDFIDSLHNFISTLVNQPELIHPDLKPVKGQKVWLMGISYGALTAVKYAHDDIKGIFSFKGAISYERQK